MAAVFAGRLLLRWAIDQARNRKQERDRASTATAADRAHGAGQRGERAAGWVALGASIALPIVFSDNRYVVDTATTVLIYVMLGWGLNVVVGLAGLLDLGYVAFYAVGAYSYAAAVDPVRLELLGGAAGIGRARRQLRDPARLPDPAPARRLPGDRHAGLRRDHPHHPGGGPEFSNGPNGISSIPARRFFGLDFTRSRPEAGTTFASFFGLPFSPMHRRSSSTT